MRILTILLVAALASGCATHQYPSKRPLSQENLKKIESADITLSENAHGVGASWFRQDSSAATSQYGLIGGLVSGIMDAIANAGPSARANKSASELAVQIDTQFLNNSFLEHANKAIEENSTLTNIALNIGDSYQPILSSIDTHNKLVVNLNYLFSIEASSITVTGTAKYFNNELVFESPYTDKNGKVIVFKQGGPVYTNTFVYESDRLPLPQNTPELQNELIQNIESRYFDESGNPPQTKTDERKKYDREIKDAKDGKLSKSEMSLFLIRNWTNDEGALSKLEINRAHEFILEYLLKDLTDASIPSWEGTDEIVVEFANGRTVRRVGSERSSGSYISSPGQLDQFTSFGNAISYPKENLKQVKKLKKQANAPK